MAEAFVFILKASVAVFQKLQNLQTLKDYAQSAKRWIRRHVCRGLILHDEKAGHDFFHPSPL